MEKMHENSDLSCALCNAEPHLHCESDEAFLCYECDARVHRANFLVARHTRAILCRRCKNPTQAHASGPSVRRMVNSTCNYCADSSAISDTDESVSGSDSGLDLNSSDQYEDEEESHVVPESVNEVVTGWKRRRGSNGLVDQDDTSCCSTSDPSNAESWSSDDDATSESSDLNPRAHKRPFFFLNVALSNSGERSYIN